MNQSHLPDRTSYSAGANPPDKSNQAAGCEYFVVRRGATALPNSLIHDTSLSYAALALLAVCLSLPAGARVGYRQLMGRGFGEQVTRNTLRNWKNGTCDSDFGSADRAKSEN